MSAHEFAALSAWVTVIAWDTIALAFFWDCIRVSRRARGEYHLARASGNGRTIVARFRYRISKWYILGSGIALLAGLLSALSNIFLTPPPPDTRIVGSIVRVALIIMIFAFWRTKRGNIALYRAADAKHARELAMARARAEAEREQGS